MIQVSYEQFKKWYDLPFRDLCSFKLRMKTRAGEMVEVTDFDKIEKDVTQKKIYLTFTYPVLHIMTVCSWELYAPDGTFLRAGSYFADVCCMHGDVIRTIFVLERGPEPEPEPCLVAF